MVPVQGNRSILPNIGITVHHFRLPRIPIEIGIIEMFATIRHMHPVRSVYRHAAVAHIPKRTRIIHPLDNPNVHSTVRVFYLGFNRSALSSRNYNTGKSNHNQYGKE